MSVKKINITIQNTVTNNSYIIIFGHFKLNFWTYLTICPFRYPILPNIHIYIYLKKTFTSGTAIT